MAFLIVPQDLKDSFGLPSSPSVRPSFLSFACGMRHNYGSNTGFPFSPSLFSPLGEIFLISHDLEVSRLCPPRLRGGRRECYCPVMGRVTLARHENLFSFPSTLREREHSCSGNQEQDGRRSRIEGKSSDWIEKREREVRNRCNQSEFTLKKQF